MNRSLLAAALALFAALLPGCGDPLPPADLTFISGSEHNEMDPQKMSWHHDIRLAHCLYDTLLTLDFNTMQLEPAVAERWEVSDDGLTYTFHLRDEAKWSNGDPVTADDFIYAWRRAMLPDLAADYTKLMFPIAGAEAFFSRRAEQLAEYARIADAGEGGTGDAAQAMWDLTLADFDDTVGLDAPDPHTLVVTLESPTSYFLELVAFATFMPVHAESVRATEMLDPATGMLRQDSSFWRDPERLVTNGPYQLGVYAFRRGVHLAQNPHYWDREAMGNTSINELIVANPQTALQTYESGRAQLWFDPPTASSLAADLVAQNRPDVHQQTMAGTYFYTFNCLPTLPDGRENPLADPRVRRALSMAIDRDTLVRTVTRLGQPVARTYIPPDALPNYAPPVDAGVGYNPDEARRLLTEAGYAVPTSADIANSSAADEGRESGAPPRPLTGLSILYNTGHGHEYLAQAVKAMWERELGVVVTLEGVETKVHGDRLKRQDFTIGRASWFGDYPDPSTWLTKMTTGDGNNDGRWSNPGFDALVAAAETERDPQRRMDLFRQAETILLEEQPLALIYQYVSLYMISPKVSGLKPNPWHRWRLEHAVVAAE